ncbi:MAG: class I SAM-dependent methyltransferase [Gemmatimonadales bacterium]
MDRSEHWEHVYRTKRPDQVSWFQAEARLSRQLIERVVPDRAARIVDIGGGASTLVDGLLASGYRHLTVVDHSPAALALARQRLGADADAVTWQVTDMLTAGFAPASFDLWHDRAVFHFLTDAPERARYVARARHALRAGGYLIVATFAEDGPARCSGLDVVRYSPSALDAEFAAGFSLVESHREMHTTPSGSQQAFTYGVFRVESG